MSGFIDYFDQLIKERTDPERKSPELKFFEALYADANQGLPKEQQLICNPSPHIKAHLQGEYAPLEGVDPKKLHTFMESDLCEKEPMLKITTRDYYKWKKGTIPHKSTIKKIATVFNIPAEMLIIGPTAYKVKYLINRNYTDLDNLCTGIGITKKELLDGLKGENDIIEKKLDEISVYFSAPIDWLKSFGNPTGKGQAKRFYYTQNQFEKEAGCNRRRLDFIKLFLDCKYGVHSTYEEIGTGTYHYQCKKSMLDIAVKILGVFKAEKIKEIPTSNIEEIVKEYSKPSGCFMILDDDMVTVWETYDRVKNDYIHHILLQLDYEPLPELKPIIE